MRAIHYATAFFFLTLSVHFGTRAQNNFASNEDALEFVLSQYQCDDPENMSCTFDLNLNSGNINQKTTYADPSAADKEYLRALQIKEVIIRSGAVGYGQAVILSCNNCISVTVNSKADGKTQVQHLKGKNLYFRPRDEKRVDEVVAALKYLQEHIVPATNLEAPVLQEKWESFLSENTPRKFSFWKFFQFYGMTAQNVSTSFKYQGAKPVADPCDHPSGTQISLQYASILQADSGPVEFRFTFGFPYKADEPCEGQLNGQCEFIAIELSGPEDHVLEVLAHQYLWNQQHYETKNSFELRNIGTEMVKADASWQRNEREKYFLEVDKQVGKRLNVKFLRY